MRSRLMAVKVTKSGNSKMLPVPASLAQEASANVGDSYTVEAIGDDIVYHRKRSQADVAGTGASKVGVVPRGRALLMTGQSSVPPLNDWDF